jgi:5,6,7,8-tetrahydromethanopterin hydro-lyase
MWLACARNTHARVFQILRYSRRMDPGFAQRIDGRIGEGWGGEGVTGVHINLVLGRIGGATAAAATGVLANPSPGYVPFLVCAGAGSLVRPATVFINKTNLDHPNLERFTWGAVQLGIAHAALDAVATEQIPKSSLDEIVLLTVVWVDPHLSDREVTTALETSSREAAYQAMTAAITNALSNTDLVAFDELVARRSTITNAFYSGT